MSTHEVNRIEAMGEAVRIYERTIDSSTDPHEVLNALHSITSRHLALNVLGALRLPRRLDDWSGVTLGETVFMHESAPSGWWEQYSAHSKQSPGPSFMSAYLRMAPFTLSEIMKSMEPIGIDRKTLDLTQNLGIRDTLTCPIGRRWIVVYWSKTVLTNRLTVPSRAMAFLAAAHAADRLRRIVSEAEVDNGDDVLLTPRELSVLRLLSFGMRIKEIAQKLELGDETVRTHVKKVQFKLNAGTSSHAVALAIRRQLIA